MVVYLGDQIILSFWLLYHHDPRLWANDQGWGKIRGIGLKKRLNLEVSQGR